MNCNHDCKNCPALDLYSDKGETNCKVMNAMIRAENAKEKAYLEKAKYYQGKKKC